jgi:hypothetical protein
MLFGCFGYVEIIKCLMIYIVRLCRLSTDAVLCSFHGCRSAYAEPRHIHGGDYMVGEHCEGFCYPTWVAA